MPTISLTTNTSLVFEAIEGYLEVVESPDPDVTADTVLIVRNARPRGYPGTPEVANLPLAPARGGAARAAADGHRAAPAGVGRPA